VHLIADFLARLKAHEYQLAILPGKHHLPKIVVLESLFFDWSEKACHGWTSFFRSMGMTGNDEMHHGLCKMILTDSFLFKREKFQ
jgi:hypothetical protein